jgi:Ca2+/Na+ antiporter
MGAVQAWLSVLIGFIVIGISFIFTQPLFDFLFAIGIAMGGNGAELVDHLTTALEYAPVMVAVSLILYGVFSSMRTDDARRYR